ncbi:MAG TPA: hypothetical protein PLC19_00185 [Marmoricola sp.]|jgi:hypothetical protein|nr:hypothetical protein [Marmoricola sp.]
MSYDPVVLVLSATLCIGFLAMMGLVYGLAKILFSAGETERIERVLRQRRPPVQTQSTADSVLPFTTAPSDTEAEPTRKSLWTRAD